MKNIRSVIATLLITTSVFFACSKSGDPTPPVNTDVCGTISAKWTSDVQPIINASCATSSSCHARGSTNAGGELTSYAQVFAKRENIKAQVQSGTMPKNGFLTNTDKNKIICWVQSGAVEN